MQVSRKLIENVGELKKALNEISVYDFDVYTSMELYYKIANKLNEVITELMRFEGLVSDEVIKQNEKLIYLLGEGLNIEVVKKINQMVADGTMDTIINHNVFNSLNNKIEDYKEELSSQIKENALQLKNIKKNNRVNIKDYGAKGDWKTHPASEFYSSLEELRKDYPLAQSLNDEMDTLALEKALNSTHESIYIPYGGYKINRASFLVSENRCIYGDGKVATQLDYIGNDDEYIFILTGHNITIKDFKISAPYNIGVKGTTTTTSFINATGKTHNTFSDLFIAGFNTALYFGENAWVQYINNVRIQNCNTGIKGNGEFNNICISECNITYCDLGIYAGGGRNIVTHMCDIERNNRAIYKTNKGDIIIRDNYFELNNNGNIVISWGMSAVDMAIIDGNSFFTQEAGEPMILYHSYSDANIVITNNNFECYNLNEGIKLACLTPTNNTQVCPVFKNNILKEGYVVGVNANKVNVEDFYKNGNHVNYTNKTDLNNVLTSSVQTIRLPFTADTKITLPSFSSLEDNTQCFKIFTFTSSNSSVTDDQYMTIDTTGKSILGTKKIYPNQVYSIYYNRLAGELEEILIVKG